MIIGVYPALLSSTVVCEPIKPSPPVTKMFFIVPPFASNTGTIKADRIEVKFMNSILFVTRCFAQTQGGMGRFALDLHTAIKDKVHLKTLQWSGSKLALVFVLPFFFVRSFWLLATRSFDVVHAQDGVVAILLYPLASLFKKPLVVVIHGLDVTYKLPLFQWLIRRALQKADKIICISSAAKDEVLKRGVDNSRIHVIPVGVTDDLFIDNKNQARANIDTQIKDVKGKYMLLSSGRLVERKGVHWFICNVLPLLVKDCPEIIFIVSGEGVQRTAIEEAIIETNQQKYVRLLGWTSDDLLKNLYNGADCFVMPNIPIVGDMEGFGRVLIEAALCQMPIVASGIEGITDALVDNKNGILVPSGDAKTHANAILDMINNPQKAQKLGKKARLFSLKAFGWQQIVQDYLHTYNQAEDKT